MQELRRPNPRRAIAFGASGLLYAFVTCAAAVRMVGGGHGWLMPTSCSFLALFLVPIIGWAWGTRRGTLRLVLIFLVIAVMTFFDYKLISDLSGAGMPSFRRVWSVIPGWLILWIVLWGGWQPAVVVLMATRVRSSATRRAAD